MARDPNDFVKVSSLGEMPEFEQSQLEAGRLLFAKRWEFVKGVVAMSGLPTPDRAEVAFAGRSNVGKSSLINALVGQKGLARTSNTPGRTQEINFFKSEGDECYLVDMPGYGYARVSRSKVDAWTGLIKSYLKGRVGLKRVFLLIDARHGVKANDTEIMDLMDASAMTYQIVLTKIDKLKRSERDGLAAQVGDILAKHPAAFPFALSTSSEKGDGIGQLRATIAELVAV